jgi:hypothetical protein
MERFQTLSTGCDHDGRSCAAGPDHRVPWCRRSCVRSGAVWETVSRRPFRSDRTCTITPASLLCRSRSPGGRLCQCGGSRSIPAVHQRQHGPIYPGHGGLGIPNRVANTRVGQVLPQHHQRQDQPPVQPQHRPPTPPARCARTWCIRVTNSWIRLDSYRTARSADFAQAGAVVDAASGDDRGDASGADQAAVLVVVVASVGVEPAWSPAGFAGDASDGRDGIDQWGQLCDVACGGPGQCGGERDAGDIGDQMVLGAGLAPVNWARSGVVPPLNARRMVESTRAADRSSRPAARSLASSRSCSCCQTPASCHSVSRRQQVAPEAPNRAVGSRFQPMPMRTTYRMPSGAARSSARSRPGWRNVSDAQG